MINQIKWAYQRVFRGYDDRIFWGFEEYLDYVVPAIQVFCEEELKTEEIGFNRKREQVFKKTLKLINDYYNMDIKGYYSNNNSSNKLWKYFGENIGYFWN
jgi:hypothetical protein